MTNTKQERKDGEGLFTCQVSEDKIQTHNSLSTLLCALTTTLYEGREWKMSPRDDACDESNSEVHILERIGASVHQFEKPLVKVSGI